MSKEKKVCEACGQTMPYIYERKLTSGLVGTLVKFREAVRYYGRYEIAPHKEMSTGSPFALTFSQEANLTPLRQYGLVAKAKHPDGTRKVGYWIFTRMAKEFLNGEREVPHHIYVKQNEKVDVSPLTVSFRDVMKSEPVYQDLDDILATREQVDGGVDANPQRSLFA